MVTYFRIRLFGIRLCCMGFRISDVGFRRGEGREFKERWASTFVSADSLSLGPSNLNPIPYTLYPKQVPLSLLIPCLSIPIPYTLYPISYTLYTKQVPLLVPCLSIPIPYTLYPMLYTLYPQQVPLCLVIPCLSRGAHFRMIWCDPGP